MYCPVPYGGGGKEAEFCASGNIKIAVHVLDTTTYKINEADLELLYIKRNYYYFPLFCNGRLL